jgi:ATP-dependent Lhr-like helicase
MRFGLLPTTLDSSLMPISDGAGFDRLALPLQRWLWEQGWHGLREAQAAALPLLLDGEQDMVIAAATASGKTEAAFLPLLTRLWNADCKGLVLYVAPMKALINDQHERLSLICERLELPVTPWHGDVGETLRKRFFADPRGVVLITPESLESLLFRRGTELNTLFAGLEAIVVDELHAFVGNERGRQLQSLLHRLEVIIGRRVRRVGLSATLGDMGLAAEFLRPGSGSNVAVIVSSAETQPPAIEFKAVLVQPVTEVSVNAAHKAIAAELFERLRDANYLIFPNTTGLVEGYADSLRLLSEAARVPLSFFPHHGRLGKSEWENTEAELKRGDRPISAICTTTLEMGIDIGAIRGVVQIGAPDTVASLCQRIGRAGRRGGEAARLWQYCVAEEPGADMGCAAGLHPDLVQALAIIQLYLGKWYEPPRAGALHYSTLVQQILALIGERHGVSAADAYRALCLNGPFGNVSEADFIELLRALAGHGLIMQDACKLLLHGPLGEKRVNHFTFFAAFPDTQEYRLMHAGKELGTLPLKLSHQAGMVVIFAGRRWQMVEIDHDKRRVDLVPAAVGQRPRTRGEGSPVHDRVRTEMRAVLAGLDEPVWLDECSRDVLRAARRQYRDLGLADCIQVADRKSIYLFLWRGDAIQNGLVTLFQHHGLKAENWGICVAVKKTDSAQLTAVLQAIATSPCPRPDQVLNRKAIGNPEKWDWALPDRLFYASFASSRLDLAGAHACCMGWEKIGGVVHEPAL